MAAWCAANSLRRFSDAEIEALAGEALVEAVVQNERGIELCGWHIETAKVGEVKP